MRFGKTLSRRYFKVFSEIHGGVPTTVNDIITEPHKVKLFSESIFVKKQRSSTIQGWSVS